MGQIVRQAKYNKFWSGIDETIEARGDAIDMLLRMLTDEQLDEVLSDMANADAFGEYEDEDGSEED